MKILLRRSERATAFGNPVFVLDVRAEISPEEKASVDKYKFGKSLLYSRKAAPALKGDYDSALGIGFDVGARLLHHATNMTISVNDLVFGKRIECKDIMEMLAAVEQIKEAAANFGSALKAATQFGGEEVLEI